MCFPYGHLKKEEEDISHCNTTLHITFEPARTHFNVLNNFLMFSIIRVNILLPRWSICSLSIWKDSNSRWMSSLT